MAVNNTLSVKEYALTGVGVERIFPITFEYTTNSSGNAENIHCQLAEKNDEGEYTDSRELTEGLGPDDFQVDRGNVKFIDDESYAGMYLVIYRVTPITQLVDFIDNGNYSLEDIERALDKLTFMIQERTGTPAGTYINIGVSLFFASILQLTNKKDFLDALFNSWSDIPAADRPSVAAEIRGQIDAASRIGNNDFQGQNTFTYAPKIEVDPTDNKHVTRKSYVDGKISTERSHTDGYFPVATGNIADSAVTTAKIPDGNITKAKIADGNVSVSKLQTTSTTVSILASVNYDSSTGSGTFDMTNRILLGISCNDSFTTQVSRENNYIKIGIYRSGSHAGWKTVTVTYAY